MNFKLLLTLAGLTAVGPMSAQTLLTSFTFEPPNAPTAANNVAAYPTPLSASTGVGLATGTHASAGTDWSAPAGNGSATSFAANEWAIGDYFQFTLSTVGSTNIFATFGMTRSGTGPATFAFRYSTNGTTFTTLPAFTLAATTWSPGTPQPSTAFTVNLSGDPTINNAAALTLRLVATVAGTTAGVVRVDDFYVSSGGPLYGVAPIPEPSAVALGALALAGLTALRRRR